MHMEWWQQQKRKKGETGRQHGKNKRASANRTALLPGAQLFWQAKLFFFLNYNFTAVYKFMTGHSSQNYSYKCMWRWYGNIAGICSLRHDPREDEGNERTQ